jgi:hypothetical protein
MEKVADGRILYADAATLWLARGPEMFVSQDAGRHWASIGRLHAPYMLSMATRSRYLRRLMRLGFHHFLPVGEGIGIAGRAIVALDSASGFFHAISEVHGSRPLALASGQGLICYGEYHSNKDRRPVSVWASEDGGITWDAAWTFAGVRHVHGVFFDSFSDEYWVTTGDSDSESAIWVTRDRFGSMDRVLGGSQQYRAVTLCFDHSHVYFGSDSPSERNHIYRLSRTSGEVERMHPVGSSVFYGCTVGNDQFFSTALEPSPVNAQDYAEVWRGRRGCEWQRIARLRKDGLPCRLFQYGQVQFPAGPGDGMNLYMTPVGTDGDQRTFRLAVGSS